MASPELSICIPTYNSEHFLPDAISSIMRQGLTDFEIVVSDNASTDGSAALIRSLENPSIRYRRNEINIGSRGNFNRCLREATGTYVKFLCADDVLRDGILPLQLKALRADPGVSLVTCDTLFTDAELNPTTVSHCLPGHHTGARITNACLSSFGNHIGGPSNFMFRRADAETLELDADFRWLSDLKFGLELLRKGSYVNVGEYGFLYRRHGATDSEVNCPPEIRDPEFCRLIDQFDWWNPLNLAQALRLSPSMGKQMLRKHWFQALKPTRVVQSLVAAFDIQRKRRFSTKAESSTR